jgi:hypothetical protein
MNMTPSPDLNREPVVQVHARIVEGVPRHHISEITGFSARNGAIRPVDAIVPERLDQARDSPRSRPSQLESPLARAVVSP